MKDLRCVSSTAQSATWTVSEGIEGLRVAKVAEGERLTGFAAMQKGEVLLTQKTSRQQAVTPILGGNLEKEEGPKDEAVDLG